jgi:putative ABC transport system permease protein
MLRSYLIIAWRNLFRNRTFSIINLFGLSLSVAFCLLLFYHIRWEQSFDTFHQRKDRLYRCEMSNFNPDRKQEKGFFSLLSGDDGQVNGVNFPIMAGPDLQRTFPEVAAF